MAKSFKPVDRGQQFLLPPSLLDWLPADHQVWFVIDAVAQMDTAVFHGRARLGGAGQAPYDPDMLLALLIWAYAGGVTSSRQVERRCREDVAFMVISGQSRPDHTTIARFRRAHQAAFEALFTQVLILCGRAGMGALAHVAIDGTKIAANASKAAFADAETLRRQVRRLILRAEADDAAADAEHGEDSGNDLPPDLRDPQARQARITALLAEAGTDPDPARGVLRRRAVRAADRVLQRLDELAERRLRRAEPVLAKVQTRLDRAETMLTDVIAQVTAENTAWRARHDALIAAGGKGLPGQRPVPPAQHSRVRRATARRDRARARLTAATTTAAVLDNTMAINRTDPDCRLMPRSGGGYTAGYNAQIAESADYLTLAVHASQHTGDVELAATMEARTAAAVTVLHSVQPHPQPLGVVLYDAGYNSDANLTRPGPDRLIAQGDRRHLAGTTPPQQPPPAHAPTREHMAWRLTTTQGRTLYRKRAATVEPVNAHLKDRRGLRTFSMRGLTAANAELHLAAAVTNLLRLHTHLTTPTTT